MKRTYLQFLKLVYHNKDVKAIVEYIMWISIGLIIAWKANPNTFHNPGLEIVFPIIFGIHGSLRLTYLLTNDLEDS